MIVDALQLLAANACFLAAGIGVLGLAGQPVAPARVRPLGLAYLAGVAAVGVASPLLLVAGLALTAPQVVVLCALLLAGGLLRRRRATQAPLPPLARPGAVPAAAIVLVAGFFCLLAVELWYQPLFAWDAWQHWTAKARSIVLLGGLDAGYFAAPAYIWWNPDYPLLLPAIEAIDFRFMGINTRILHLQFGLLLLGFVLAHAELTRGRVPRTLYWPVAAAVLWAPTVAIQTASAYADVPLGIFFACAGVCAWRWLETGEAATLALFALFAAASLATKMEGQIFVAALLVVLVALAARRSWGRAGHAAGAGFVAFLAGIVPWRLWTSVHDVAGVYSTSTLVRRLLDPDSAGALGRRAASATAYLAGVLLDPTAWLLVVPIAVAAAVLALAARAGPDGPVLVLGTLALAFAGLVVVYAVTPFPLEWHLDRSAWRVVTGLGLFAGAFTGPLLALSAGVAERPRSAPPAVEDRPPVTTPAVSGRRG